MDITRIAAHLRRIKRRVKLGWTAADFARGFQEDFKITTTGCW